MVKWYENDEFNRLHKELVPQEGQADSVAGEMMRAAARIGYRFYNDGDRSCPIDVDVYVSDWVSDYYDDAFQELIDEGVPEEEAEYRAWDLAEDNAREWAEEEELPSSGATMAPPTWYLTAKGNAEVRGIAQSIIDGGYEMTDEEYDQAVRSLCDAVLDDVKSNPGLRDMPTEDMWHHRGVEEDLQRNSYPSRAEIGERVPETKSKSWRERGKEFLSAGAKVASEAGGTLFNKAKEDASHVTTMQETSVAAYTKSDGTRVKAHTKKVCKRV